MPKHPTKPGMQAVNQGDGSDTASSRHRACEPARQALHHVEKLEQRLDYHVEKLEQRLDIHAATDNEQLSAIRSDVEDVRGDVKLVGSHVDGLRDEVKELSSHVGNLRVDMAKTLSVVSNISNSIVEQQEIKRVKMVAEVETGTAEKIAIIKDSVDQKKSKRTIWRKVIAAIIGLLSGMIVEHFR